MKGYFFDYLNKVWNKVLNSDITVLFLDYDGTLVPFKDRPEEATPTADLKAVLKKLAQSPRCYVTVISGRPVKDLKKMLGIKGLTFVGIHGLHTEFASGKHFIWKRAEDGKQLLEEIKKRAINELGSIEGVYIEDKDLTIALHFRQVTHENVRGLKQGFIEIVEGIDKEKTLEVVTGNKVLEVRPKGWHKGRAVELILGMPQFENRKVLPMYFGDDTTDEDAFSYLEGRGTTVVVSKNQGSLTKASYYLRNNKEVINFLKQFLTILDKNPECKPASRVKN